MKKEISIHNLKLYVLDYYIGEWSGANISDAHNEKILGMKVFPTAVRLGKEKNLRLFFSQKLQRCSSKFLQDKIHRCNFWLKNNFENFFSPFPTVLP